MLGKFWINFHASQKSALRSLGLGLGAGVTARDEDDALTLLFEKIPNARNLEISEVLCDVIYDELENDHVKKNMGDMSSRGVWFPLR